MGIDPYNHDIFVDQELLDENNVVGEDWNICLSTMENKASNVLVKRVSNIEIISLDNNEREIIPYAFAKSDWAFDLEDSPRPEDIEKYPHLKDLPFKFFKNKKISILIGPKRNDITEPLDFVRSPVRGGPYGILYRWGWATNGEFDSIESSSIKIGCHHVKSLDSQDIDNKLDRFFAQDFCDSSDQTLIQSLEDVMWQNKVRSSIKHLPDGHFEIALPFRTDDIYFPNNYAYVLQRLNGLKKRLIKDRNFFEEYAKFMNAMIDNKFAEKIPQEELETPIGKKWYISHHGVIHQQKKKLRVVFDCSAKYQGVSLNTELLQGPDLTNNLLGVLLRFRQNEVAFIADIEKMFYQVRVTKEDANFLRFLWFPENDVNCFPEQYRILVHVFGATSSPSCSNFALKETATNKNLSEEVINAINKNFYVDDIMKSSEYIPSTIKLINQVTDALAEGGFNLTSFVSNSRKILASLPMEKLGKSLGNIDLQRDDLPYDRALGVLWDVENDKFGFKVNIKYDQEQPVTKRRILSQIFSLYDPLNLICPVIVVGKRIFQKACAEKVGWDGLVPKGIALEWKSWNRDINLLNTYQVDRCLKISSNMKRLELHIFSDGSETAYGSVAYLRVVTIESKVNSNLIMAKSRLTPIGNSTLKTIPRIELNAAKLSVEIYQKIKNEIDFEIDECFFWSDSQTVLNYINSNSARFQRFVGNRVSFIRSFTKPEEWNFVPGIENPADLLSRGMTASKFVKSSRWKFGPEFLKLDKCHWPKQCEIFSVSEKDDEVKKPKKVINIKIHTDHTKYLIDYSSSIHKTKKNVAVYRKIFMYLKLKLLRRTTEFSEIKKISLEDLTLAEEATWRYIQSIRYEKVIKTISNSNAQRTSLKKGHSLVKLDPFIDERGILRVGGRLRRLRSSNEVKHPIILPNNEQIVKNLIIQSHNDIGHLGRESTLCKLREKYWIVQGKAYVRKLLNSCIACRKYQARPSEQKMSDLPLDRISSNNPAFSSTGIDFFGPFFVIRGRTQVKRYGVVFTCLASRAIHLEVACSLDTDSFICSFRRFLSRRGSVKIIRSDNGTNFVGAQKELREAIEKWNVTQLDEFFKIKNIDWKQQPPFASHFGGVWERTIRIIRKVLNSLMNEQQIKISDELLNTLICEVEYIVNSRPITAISDDPNDMTPLTPNHLLLLNFEPNLPPGIFLKDDLYSRKRWRQMQYLADLFWQRWQKEYLSLLQERQKWTLKKRSHKPGDLVIVIDQLLPRNQWNLGRIVDVKIDPDTEVRSARVKIAKLRNGKQSQLETTIIHRPISKFILLEESND